MRDERRVGVAAAPEVWKESASWYGEMLLAIVRSGRVSAVSRILFGRPWIQ